MFLYGPESHDGAFCWGASATGFFLDPILITTTRGEACIGGRRRWNRWWSRVEASWREVQDVNRNERRSGFFLGSSWVCRLPEEMRLGGDGGWVSDGRQGGVRLGSGGLCEE